MSPATRGVAPGGGQAPPARSKPPRRWLVEVALALLARPHLWGTALVQLGRLARPGWWRRPPFLPSPDPAYLRFRLQTAYGDADRLPDPADVVSWLRWCRAWPRATS